MSGQEKLSETKEAFKALLRLLEKIFEYDGPFPEGFSDSFINQYEKMGALDWHQFYLKEGEAENILFDEFGSELGLTKIQNDSISDHIIQMEKQLNSLDDNITPEQELRDKALSSGIRWMIIARTLKVSLNSYFRFETPISKLINLSKKGDKDAFLKLVKLDSTFLSTEFGGKILREVELKQDQKYKEKLAKSLIPEKNFWTLKHPKKNLRDALALLILSHLGYIDQRYSLWADFMADQGFDNLLTEQNIASIVKRYKIPKKYPKRLNNLDR